MEPSLQLRQSQPEVATQDGKESRFLRVLHEEKLRSQERRHALITRKLSWVTGLLAVGSIRIEFVDGQPFSGLILLYLAPIAAAVFDLYIYGENFGIKRMGVFVRTRFPNDIEGIWETFLVDKRDRFSRYALPISSAIILVAAATFLLSKTNEARQSITFVGAWICVSAIMIAAIYILSGKALAQLDRQKAD